MEYEHQIIEELLHKFKPVLLQDYGKYKNHVYRVFLNCLLLDNSAANVEKYAIAAVLHDIGIWTDDTIDYLDPSIVQVHIYLNQTGKQYWADEIILMINWHHKISNYRGSHEMIVETFRKADWMDLSLGLLSFGADSQKIETNRIIFSNLGFHIFLLKKILKNLFLHPFNPLPMFRR